LVSALLPSNRCTARAEAVANGKRPLKRDRFGWHERGQIGAVLRRIDRWLP
jgi:hypothetical protein